MSGAARDNLSLPFDQYQRYRLVADLLAQLRGGGEPLVVLDVGGRTALLRSFLEEGRVHLVDVEASEEQGLVLGDGASLPFEDDAVDAVVTIDTFEHVPPASRERFVAECARVARRWVVIAGPFGTEGVAEAEALLTSFLGEKLGIRHRYLSEHSEHGLPELEATEAQLRAAGAKVASVGHASLPRWLALMCLAMYIDHDAPLRTIAPGFFRFYNAALYALDQRPPVYRHAVVAALDGSSLPELRVASGEPADSPETVSALGHLARELARFDALRDVVKREWARLEEVNRGLSIDLEQHEVSLAECREIRDEQRGVIAKLRERADELGRNEKELEREMERERAESRLAIRDLESDLAGQRATGAALEEALSAHRTLVRELEAQIEEQTAELDVRAERMAAEREAFERLRAELAAELEKGQAEVEARGRELERVEADLERATAEFARLHEALRVELAGLRAEVDARGEALEERTAALAEEQAARARERAGFAEERAVFAEEHTRLAEELATLYGEIEARGREMERLAGELAEERELIARLRAELASRWRSFKRVFGPKRRL